MRYSLPWQSKILNRNNGDAGGRAETGADKIPADLGTIRIHITAYFVPDMFWRMFIPTGACIVIMGAGITDAVIWLVIWKITAVIILKGKLQYFHTGQMVAVPKSPNLIGDNTEIFCDNRKICPKISSIRSKKASRGPSVHLPESAFSASAEEPPSSFPVRGNDRCGQCRSW